MRFLLKFLGLFLGCTVIAAVFWEHFLVGKIYYCVWGIAYIDFFFPNHWYHGADSGDMMKPGWSKSKLLVIWYSIHFISVVLSAVLTYFTRHTNHHR